MRKHTNRDMQMRFEQIKGLQDWKVIVRDHKVIGLITECYDGFRLTINGTDFKFKPQKTLIQAQRQAEVFYETYAPHLKGE